MATTTAFLDCVSLACPSVYLKTMEKLDVMQSGEVLEVITDTTTVDQLIFDYEVKSHRVLNAGKD